MCPAYPPKVRNNGQNQPDKGCLNGRRQWKHITNHNDNYDESKQDQGQVSAVPYSHSQKQSYKPKPIIMPKEQETTDAVIEQGQHQQPGSQLSVEDFLPDTG